jgi:5-methylcytosine-specific restriction endonuclease McrA
MTMALTKAQREVIKNKYGGRCAYCGCELPERWHVDHMEPVERKLKYDANKGYVATGELRRPENDNFDNLMPACPPCNIDKHALPLYIWRRYIQDSAITLTRDNSTYRRAKRFGIVTETGNIIKFFFEEYGQKEAQKHG